MGLSRNLLPGLVVRDKLRPTRTGKNQISRDHVIHTDQVWIAGTPQG